MPKTVYIIHGCPSNVEKAMNPATRTYDKHWIPWTKRELMAHGINVEAPLMPNPWEPNYQAFKEAFDRFTFTENDILIGHSCGTTFLIRWLGDTKKKVAKLILVAPWAIADQDDKNRREFYEHPIDKTIKSRVGEIVMFTADDEVDDGKKSVKIIHDAIGGRIIELKGHGHYTQWDIGTEEFPELLDEII